MYASFAASSFLLCLHYGRSSISGFISAGIVYVFIYIYMCRYDCSYLQPETVSQSRKVQGDWDHAELHELQQFLDAERAAGRFQPHESS